MKKLSILASAVALTASSLFGDIAVGKGLSVSGYLDILYTNVDNDAATEKQSGFNAATAEIDFSFDFGNGLSATVDLEGNVGDAGAADTNIEQARIDYAFGDSAITLGKFDTVIGLEALEAPDLYQITNSLTFAVEPTQHTGFMYSYDNGMFNAAVGAVNSIYEDNNNSGAANGAQGVGTEGNDLSFLLHAGLTPTDALSFNINYAFGDEGAAAATTEDTLFTIDASWSDFGWTVGVEYVAWEVETAAGAQTNDLDGFMVMANYMFTEQFGLTARYSTTEDEGTASGIESTEFTISPSYAVTPNWFLLAEYRAQENETIATGATNDVDTFSVETVLTF